MAGKDIAGRAVIADTAVVQRLESLFSIRIFDNRVVPEFIFFRHVVIKNSAQTDHFRRINVRQFIVTAVGADGGAQVNGRFGRICLPLIEGAVCVLRASLQLIEQIGIIEFEHIVGAVHDNLVADFLLGAGNHLRQLPGQRKRAADQCRKRHRHD